MYWHIGDEGISAGDKGISAQASTAACWSSFSTCFNATRTLFLSYASYASLDRHSPVFCIENSDQNGLNLKTVKLAIPSHGM
jgi:hypothetical protein